MAESERRLVEEIDQVWEVLAALGIGMAVLDGSRVTDVTDNVPPMFGVDRDWMLGKDASRSLGPEDADFESNRRAALLRSPSPQRHRVDLVRGDGTPFQAELATSRTFDPTVLALWERSELHQTEHLLDQLMALVDHVPNGLLIFDVEQGSSLHLAFVNKAGVSIAGIDGFEDLGGRFEDLFPSVPDATRAALVRLADTDDRLVLPSGQCLPENDPRVFECLGVGLPGPRIALRFMDLTGLLERENLRHRLLRRLVNIGDDERARLAMAVHDDVIQEFAAAAMLVESAERDGGNHPDLDRALGAMRRGITSLREIVLDLSPPSPHAAGFKTSVERVVAHVLGTTASTALLVVELDEEPAESVQIAALKILTELLRNVVRHASASRVEITLRSDRSHLVFSVRDDGVGFGGGPVTGHFGLQMVIDRATALGGQCRIDAGVGDGTAVEVLLPIEEPEAPTGSIVAGVTPLPSDELGLVLAVSQSLAAVGNGAPLGSAMEQTCHALSDAGIPCRLERARSGGGLLDLTSTEPTLDLAAGPILRAPLEAAGRSLGSLALEEGARTVEPAVLSWLGHQIGNALLHAEPEERDDFWRSIGELPPLPASL